jgi:molybdate transport system substrate-binding protein
MFALDRRLLLAAMAGLILAAPARAQEPLTVFAAASLRNVLDAIALEWVKTGQPKPRLVYAASGALARQIEQGAPADLFIAADDRWMDYAVEKKSVDPATRRIIAGNRLVAIGAANATRKLEIAPGLAADTLLAGGRLVVGDEKSVPAGAYAKAVLEKLTLWQGLQPALIRVENVRVALALVARGEVDTGIVYASDAAAEPRVTIIGIFPPSLHPPVRYPAALTTNNPKGAGFLAFLGSETAQALLVRHGFSPE